MTNLNPFRFLPVLFALASVVAGCSTEQASDAELDLVASDDLARKNMNAPYAGYDLFVETDSSAADQADEWRESDPDGAAIMDIVANQPQSLWIGDWGQDVQAEVDDAITRAGDELQVLTVYNIPNRDCGAWSAGGVADAQAYGAFIDEVAAGLDGRLAIIVLEPDGLAHTDCLDEAGLADRHAMMADAVETLTAAGGQVYIDAGDSNWIPAEDMAVSLEAAGVHEAAGIALNVSHTEFSSDEADYADELRAILGDDVHFVIDTSRNGLGPSEDNEWCNPLGRAHGLRPTLTPPIRDGLDAALWIKRPGESDGLCNGGPEAGHWWADYELGLAVAAGL